MSIRLFWREWGEENDELILELIWICKRPAITRTILKKKNKIGELTQSNFKTYSRAIIIKKVWHWYKDKYIDKGTE